MEDCDVFTKTDFIFLPPTLFSHILQFPLHLNEVISCVLANNMDKYLPVCVRPSAGYGSALSLYSGMTGRTEELEKGGLTREESESCRVRCKAAQQEHLCDNLNEYQTLIFPSQW